MLGRPFYRQALGMPGCSPSGRQAQSSKQWQSIYEIGDESLRKAEMENVEWCVDGLPMQYRQAIGFELRNRSSRAKIWRASGEKSVSFSEALEKVLPVMRGRGGAAGLKVERNS